MKKIFNRIFEKIEFWRKKKNFIVLRIFDGGVGAVIFRVGKNNKIKFIREINSKDLDGIASSKQVKKFNGTAIISICPSLISSSFLPISFLREEYANPISSVELENFLSSIIGRIINKYRREASKRFNIDDFDVVLAKARVFDFRVDGHRIVNPVGFNAKKVEAVLELVLVPRDIYSAIKDLFVLNPECDDTFITESGKSEVLSLAKTKSPPLAFLNLTGRENNFYFFISDKHSMSGGRFKWSSSCLIEQIMVSFSISRDSALHIYNLYLNGELSCRFKRFISKIEKPCIELFFKEIKAKKIKGSVYIDTDINMPFNFPLKKYNIIFENPPLDALFNKMEFGLDLRNRVICEKKIFRYISPFFEYYYSDRNDSVINRWLKRRISWLGTI